MGGGFFGGGGGGFTQPTPSSSGRGNWRNAINVTDYGATGDGSTNNLDAFQAAISAARDAWNNDGEHRPVYVPAGTYRVGFTNGYAASGGRLLIDWPGFEIFGEGREKSIIEARSSTAALSRRESIINDTVAKGRRTGALISGTTVQLATVADAANFAAGDWVYFAANPDGTSRRGPNTATSYAAGCRVMSRNLALGQLTISDLSEFSSFVTGDYIFITGKVFLETPGDHAKWTAGMGVIVSPNADGSEPREVTLTASTEVLEVHASENAITVSHPEYITGFADEDYLFPQANFALFYATHGADADEVPYDVTIRDLTITGETYGRTPTDTRNDVFTFLFFQSLGNGDTYPYTIRVDRVRSEDFTVHFAHSEGTASSTPTVTMHFTDSEHSTANQIVEFYGIASCLTKRFIAERCYFHGTDSHLLYIHDHVSLLIDKCRFDDTSSDEGGKEAIDHWGQFQTAAQNSITNCWFGPDVRGRGILTGTNSSYYIAGNTFECLHAIFIRSHCLIVGNVFRPQATSANCIATYFNCNFNAQVKILGNSFDTMDVPELGSTEFLSINHPCSVLVSGNTFTYGTRTDFIDTGPDAKNENVTCINVSSGAIQRDWAGGNPDTGVIVTVGQIDILNNHVRFNPTTGQHVFVIISDWPEMRIAGNRFTGRSTTDRGAIRASSSLEGSGYILIADNYIDHTGGGGIFFNSTNTGSPRFEISRNTLICNTANKNCIDLQSTGATTTYRIAGNIVRAHAGGYGLAVSSAVTAGTVTGGENDWGTSRLAVMTRQTMHTRRGVAFTQVASAASINVSPDVSQVEITGSTTIDGIHYNGAHEGLAFHGNDLELYWVGTAALGAGDNVSATGGARTAGTITRLRYNATIDSSTTPLGRISSFVTATGVITLVTGGDTANFRVGMALKVDDDIAAGSPRTQTAPLYVVSIGVGTVTVNTVSSNIPVTGIANNDYLFLGAGRWVEVP